jgi:mono/diheme cytochrome c family protein
VSCSGKIVARATQAATLSLALGLFAAAQAYEPSMNYKLQCMGCHTPDGAGVPGRVPSIRTTLLPLARMPEGRRFLVQVPGSAQSTLSNAQLAELLNWMIQNLSTASGKTDYKRFTESEVAGYRPHALVEVRATRERLLAGLPAIKEGP